MFKKILFAVVPMVLVAGTSFADENLLEQLAQENTDTIADVVDDESPMGKDDVDQLLGDSDESDEEMVAACYSRVRYSRSYHSYPSYGYGYSYPAYNYHHYPTYSYTYHRPVVYKPVHYNHYTPVYTSYWGCW